MKSTGHKTRLALIALLWLTCTGSARAQSVPEAAGNEFFEKSVRPILIARCIECHQPEDTNGGLLLDSRDGWMKGGDSGAAIVPGKPDESRLIEAVRYKNRDLQMPPSGALKPAEVATLEKWIRIGAPDPRIASVTTAPGPTGMSNEEGRRFWSFKPVERPAVPRVQDQKWAVSPIDAFVLARLEANGFHPARHANKRTLIRRVTFDLTGLPPTPGEIDAYLADDSADAWARVVERLLASPQYGVRWGRHWLDVARYADSNGLDENLAFGNAWRYRDYVVDSFNADKPFDRFLTEQLAGDLLPDASRETKTATGFLMLGAKVLAEPDREKLVMDTIDEQLDTTGKAFMGLTLGCARCHDHKFDPIKQTDYYGLAAIFKSTRSFAETNTGAIKHWYEHSFADEEELETLKSVDAAIKAKKNEATTYRNKAMTKLRTEARAKATEYLVAATKFDPDAPLSHVAEIAKPLGLHPRILHHCRLHLEYNREHPVFEAWHKLASTGGAPAVRAHYQPLFDAASGKPKPQADQLSAVSDAREALNDVSGFLAVPPRPDFAFDAETLTEYHRLQTDARVLESNSFDITASMGVAEGETLTDLPLHIRGSHRNLGKPVTRRLPKVFANSNTTLPAKQSGRLQLAQWLASGQHPLTARVYVNRIWGWHFGRPIVETTENFGAFGNRPSHPLLLDWLASEFVARGWSTRELHRLILNSRTYQLSTINPATRQSDPENKLLSRFTTRRLDAEQIRDAVLATSGRLDTKLGGKTVPLRNRQFVFDHTSIDHTKYDSLRRAIYLPVIRNNLYSLFSQFDFPDPTMPTGHRNETTVAPQALWLLNSSLVQESADAFAKQLLSESESDAGRIDLAYQRAVGRRPEQAETQRVLKFLGGSNEAPEWSMFCQSLFASNEFVYVR